MDGDRAAVLGGGGSAGNAWVIGVIAGLSEAGIEVADADLIIGTSAGSTAAAQVTSATPSELLAQILGSVSPPGSGRSSAADRPAPVRPAVDHFQRTTEIIAAAVGPADMRRRLGAGALELIATADEGAAQTQWAMTVASRLPSPHWPSGQLLVTAVDARTGEPVVFDHHSGVALADAIAASTASGLPYRVGDDWYVDGGYRRSSENADLASGYARVLVLSPLGGRSRAPLGWGMHLAAQLEELRAGGSRVEAILPDGRALDAFGSNLMDLSRRAPAAEAGYEQGTALAEQLAEFWR